MPRETMTALKSRIHWFVLPLIITLLTWLVVVSYDNKVANQVQSTQGAERHDLLQKMWVKMERMEGTINQNNTILMEKADRRENEAAHREVLGKLDNLEKLVNKTYTKKYGYVVIFPDTNLVVSLIDSVPGSKALSFVNAGN